MIISIVAIIALLIIAGYSLYRERSRAGILLFAALAVTALLQLFDLLSLYAQTDAIFWKQCSLTAESLLPPLWILCSLTFARQSGPWKMSGLLKTVVASTFLFALLPIIYPMSNFYYAPDFPGEQILFLGNVGFYFYIFIMATLVAVLVNFEVTLANASPKAFWEIKFEIIGLATIVTVQAFYFSQALLYRSLNMNYLSLRSFVYLIAVALIAYSFVCRRSKVRIQVSRQVAFKSFVLFAVSIYMLLLGFLGEGMKYLGTFFPRSMTVSLAFLLGIAFLLLLLSEQFRRKVKVILHKNFYQNKHDYRTHWLHFTEQLATSGSGEELIQRVLQEYCNIFGISGAALFLLENSRGGYCLQAEQEIKLHNTLIAKDNSLISFMTKSSWIICISEDNPEVLAEDSRYFSENSVAFVVPLFGRERLEGFIVLGQPINREETYIYEDYDLMKTIARQASLAIMHQKLTEQASAAREIEAIGNVATFVAHDLKNLVSNLSMIVQNAARHIHNPDFQSDMLASLGNTVDKMQKLIGKLQNLGEQDEVNLQRVNLLELAKKTTTLLVGSRIVVSGKAEIVFVEENEIQKVILNLLMNAIEASDPNEQIVLEVGCLRVPFIKIIDKGCGISTEFLRTKLYKPFRTTKPQGLGIGLYQCRQIVEAHGGRIEVSSVEGEGTVFTVWFVNSERPAIEIV